MRRLVVDASVAAKWFLPEEGADAARRLLDGRSALCAPDLLWIEFASVAWKCARRKIITPGEAVAMVEQFAQFPVESHPGEPLLPAALRLALDLDRTVYDCLYLALADRESATLVTEDARLVRALTRGPLARRVALLADLP